MNLGLRRIAAIDVGSNSAQLVIANVFENGSFEIIESMKEQTRMSSFLDKNLILPQEALQKLSAVLLKMKEFSDAHHAELRAIGTQVFREARNSQDFCLRLAKRTGVELEIVSGNEEARLVYLGVNNSIQLNDAKVFLCDIGGGSAELLVGKSGSTLFSTSLKLGAVRLTVKFLHGNPYTDVEIANLHRYVHARLLPVIENIKKYDYSIAIGSSGTIKAVKNLALGLLGNVPPANFHGQNLSRLEIEMVMKALMRALEGNDRKNLPGLDPKRQDIIFAGTVVLYTLTKMIGIEQWKISTVGIKEGIILDSIIRLERFNARDIRDIRWNSVVEYGTKLNISEVNGKCVSELSKKLFAELKNRHKLDDKWLELLSCAAYLHECGKILSLASYHKHSSYFIKHSNMSGFSVRELNLISCIARFHRKRLPRQDDEIYCDLDLKDKGALNFCAVILRLVVSLSRGCMGEIQELGLLDDGKFCTLKIKHQTNETLENSAFEVSLEKVFFEQVFNLPLVTIFESS